MRKLFIPYQEIDESTKKIIFYSWISLILGSWLLVSFVGERHLFPSIGQVIDGFKTLYTLGLVTHINTSLGLFIQSVLLSVVISIAITYSTTLPFFKPIGKVISQFRYLPLAGISFYLAVLITNARTTQIVVLVIFMTLFLVTTLVSYLDDIPQEEYDQAKTLGCTRWETLLEVAIKGRLDYVIEGIRQNLAIVWMSIVTVESLLLSAGGLGTLINNGTKQGTHGRIIALQIIILVIGILLDKTLTFIRRKAFPYSKF